MSTSRRQFVIACAGVATARIAVAQDARKFPDRPVRLVVPIAAGGPTDVFARVMAERLTRVWEQPCIVDSRPGANGLIGAAAVAKAVPDGHTLLFANSGFLQSVLMQARPPFRLEELAPVALVATAGPGLAIDASIPARTLAEFVALARRNPGKYSYGSTGIGSTTHMVGELLNQAAGIELLHVAFKGEGAALPALLAGQVSAVIGSAGGLARQVSTGRIRMLAISGPHRAKGLPELPTFAESGYPSVNLIGWAGVFAPAGTPREIVQKVSDEVIRSIADPDLTRRIYEFGFEPAPMPVGEFTKFISGDSDQWARVIKLTGVKIE